MKLDKQNITDLAAILVWAVNHDIDCTLSTEKGMGPEIYPVLTFVRDGYKIKHAFWSLTHLSEECSFIWRDIGMKLCIQPPEFVIKDSK